MHVTPGLRYAADDWGAPELAAIAEHRARLSGAGYVDDEDDGGEREEYDQHDELGAWQDDDGVAGVLDELLDEALHRDTCYPWTAERVPVLAAIAVDGRVTDLHRSRVLAGLYRIATVGRRRPDQGDNAVAARAAVAEAVPAIVARAGDSELFGFLATALAAACAEVTDDAEDSPAHSQQRADALHEALERATP